MQQWRDSIKKINRHKSTDSFSKCQKVLGVGAISTISLGSDIELK